MTSFETQYTPGDREGMAALSREYSRKRREIIVQCACGRTVIKDYLSRHLKTKLHTARLVARTLNPHTETCTIELKPTHDDDE